jgi:hypothetical protein
MPGATRLLIVSTSEAVLGPPVVLSFLQGTTENSLESGAMILTDLATLSLFLKNGPI